MQFSSSLHLFALLSLATADCTKWTSTRWHADDASSWSTAGEIAVASLVCPKTNSSGCAFAPNTYNVTIPRTLNISASAADTDSIFALARDGYPSSSSSKSNSSAPVFAEHITYASTGNVVSALLKVEAGKNATLYYIPYLMTSSGVLGGCGNASLDGVFVAATAAAVNSSNITDGTWGVNAVNLTGAGNRAVGTGAGGLPGLLLACGVAVFASFAL